MLQQHGNDADQTEAPSNRRSRCVVGTNLINAERRPRNHRDNNLIILLWDTIYDAYYDLIETPK